MWEDIYLTLLLFIYDWTLRKKSAGRYLSIIIIYLLIVLLRVVWSVDYLLTYYCLTEGGVVCGL